MTLPHLSTADVIKLFTKVPHNFVDEFFHLYDRNTAPTDFTIDLDKLAKWLDTNKGTLLATLKESYQENVDFKQQHENIRKPSQKYGGNRFIRVMITPNCMRRLCMRSRSKMAETVRTYFIEVQEFLVHYNDEIVDGLMRKIEDLGKKKSPCVINIIRASKTNSSLYKLAKTKDLILQGGHEDAELLSVYKTPFRKEVDKFVTQLMEVKGYKKRGDIYHVDWEIIYRLVGDCAQFSIKLQHASAKSIMDGEYYMIFIADPDADADTDSTAP